MSSRYWLRYFQHQGAASQEVSFSGRGSPPCHREARGEEGLKTELCCVQGDPHTFRLIGWLTPPYKAAVKIPDRDSNPKWYKYWYIYIFITYKLIIKVNKINNLGN